MKVLIRIIILIVIGSLNYFPVIAQNQYSNYKTAIQKIDALTKKMRPVPPCSGPISRNENQSS
jgi:hypothetical protein